MSLVVCPRRAGPGTYSRCSCHRGLAPCYALQHRACRPLHRCRKVRCRPLRRPHRLTRSRRSNLSRSRRHRRDQSRRWTWSRRRTRLPEPPPELELPLEPEPPLETEPPPDVELPLEPELPPEPDVVPEPEPPPELEGNPPPEPEVFGVGPEPQAQEPAATTDTSSRGSERVEFFVRATRRRAVWAIDLAVTVRRCFRQRKRRTGRFQSPRAAHSETYCVRKS